MALPSSLSSLTVREAISDALHRVLYGVDAADLALFDSGLTQDATFDIDGKLLEGLDAIHTGLYDHISQLDTTHFMTNIRIDVKEGASTAAVTAHSLAQHYRPKEGREAGTAYYLAGNLYYVDCVKDDQDGLWKAKHWELKVIWSMGDVGVMKRNE